MNPADALNPDFPRSFVSVHAKIGRNVRIAAGTVVHESVEIGNESIIQEHGLIGLKGVTGCEPLVIGRGSLIRSHTVLYLSGRFGNGLETGHHAVIRENTVAGDNLRVGNFSDIEGDCIIGDYCRFHGYVHVGKGSRIGNFVWLFSLSTHTNDPLPPSLLNVPVTIEDGAVVCVGATLMPGSIIGKGAFVCAGACVRGKIPPGAVVSGPEGRIVNHVSSLVDLGSGIQHPWMKHYQKGYPEEAIGRLRILEEEILRNRSTLEVE